MIAWGYRMPNFAKKSSRELQKRLRDLLKGFGVRRSWIPDSSLLFIETCRDKSNVLSLVTAVPSQPRGRNSGRSPPIRFVRNWAV